MSEAFVCPECGSDESKRPLPEAGSAVHKFQLSGTSESLRHTLEAHDLSTGAADCGCVVMDYQFYPCKNHSK